MNLIQLEISLRKFILNKSPKNFEYRSWPLLVFDNDNGVYFAKSQLSTYEFIIKVSRFIFNKMDSYYYKEQSEFIKNINEILKKNPLNYGKYADNDAWSPHMSPTQLNNFLELCINTWINMSMKQYIPRKCSCITYNCLHSDVR